MEYEGLMVKGKASTLNKLICEYQIEVVAILEVKSPAPGWRAPLVQIHQCVKIIVSIGSADAADGSGFVEF